MVRRDGLTASVTELQEFFAADVGDQVSERTVGGDDLAAEAMVVELGRQPD